VTSAPDATALAAALRDAGITCTVESRAALALIVASTADGQRLADDDLRRRVLALAREHGFTHVAVELGLDATVGDASLLRH
jgi:sugar phosphate isomerase/epimerase